jgi:hypothetical protein
MNRAATLTLNAPLLMLVAALALSTPFTAGAAPAFLITPNSKPSNLRRKKKTMPQAKQTQESRQSADNKKTTNTSQLQKRITSQQAAIAQKDKLIQQLKKQLAATPQRILHCE